MLSDLELQKKRHEIEGARRVEKHLRALEAEKVKAEKQLVSYNQLLAPQRGEEFVYCVGEIGFLFLDLRSTRLEPGGAQAAENELMSNLQWEFVEKNLESSRVQLWVVCSELPVVDELPEELKAVSSSSSDSTLKAHPERQSWWGRNPEAQKRLLEMLFDWKVQQSNREFVLLSGASSLRFRGKSSVKDTKMRTKAEQYIVGAIAASPSHGVGEEVSFTLRKTWTIHERFEVEHTEITNERAFATLTLDTSASLSSALDIGAPAGKTRIQITCMSSCDHAQEMAQVLLGPVVGFVDDTSAVVLLEVDRDFDVISVITNPLTGESRRQFQHFQAKTPNSFFWTHLRPEHYYQISFVNIQSAPSFQASFSTVARFPRRFELVALCNDDLLSASEVGLNSDENDGGGGSQTSSATTLWGSVADKAENVPFARVNLTIHLGGQFCVKTNVFVQEALVLAGATMVVNGSSQDGGNSRVAVIEKLRQMYRLAWNLPGVREALAHGAHIMLSNKSDELGLESSSELELFVQELLVQVHQEYQNLLLPPSKRAHSRSKAQLRKAMRAMTPLSHLFGAFGLFFLPIGEFGGVTVYSGTWDALKSFLSSPHLSVLMLVTQEAIIEDSPEDVAEKTHFDGAYKTKFGFYQRELLQLLEMLFEWKTSTDKNSSSGHEVVREVVFISGNRHRSFDSVIEEAASSVNPSPHLGGTLHQGQHPTSQVILQYVVGPLTQSRSARKGDLELAIFPQGTLFNKYSYHHFFTKRVRNNRLREQEQSESTAADDPPTALIEVGGEDHSGNEGLISGQLAHFAISIEDVEPKLRASHVVALPDSTKPAYTASRWDLICINSMEAHQHDDDASLEDAVDECYRHEGRIKSRQVGRTVNDWRLLPVQPLWLDEVSGSVLASFL